MESFKISNLEEISPSWITENKMHHGTTHSRFYSLATGKYNPHKLKAIHVSTGGRVVGCLVFEEYPPSSKNCGSFTLDNKHYLMNCVGRVGLYTTPEYRKQGIARLLSEKFISVLTSRPQADCINILAHEFTTVEFFRPLKNHRNWFPTPSAVGRNHWEHQIKKSFLSLPSPTCVTKDKAIEVLVSRGWQIKREPSGRLSLEDVSESENWGTLTRTEFKSKVPAKFLQSQGPPTPLVLARPPISSKTTPSPAVFI